MKLLKYLITFCISSLFINSIDNFKKIYLNKEFYKLRNIFYELNSIQFTKFYNSKICLIRNFPNKQIFMQQLIAKIFGGKIKPSKKLTGFFLVSCMHGDLNICRVTKYISMN